MLLKVVDQEIQGQLHDRVARYPPAARLFYVQFGSVHPPHLIPEDVVRVALVDSLARAHDPHCRRWRPRSFKNAPTRRSVWTLLRRLAAATFRFLVLPLFRCNVGSLLRCPFVFLLEQTLIESDHFAELDVRKRILTSCHPEAPSAVGSTAGR